MKYRRWISLVFILQFSSCGLPLSHVVQKRGKRPFINSDKEFGTIMEKFEQESKKRSSRRAISVGSIPVVFGLPDNPSFQGVCEIYDNNQRAVVIRKSWWKNASSMRRESLVFHEFGHCHLGREHDCRLVRDNSGRRYKKSLMHSEIVNGGNYRSRREYYLQELFNPSGPTPSGGECSE